MYFDMALVLLALVVCQKKVVEGGDNMREIVISLNSIEKVRNFVSITTKCDAEMDLVSDRYVIDAKSIMGIFSMDLSKPIILRIHEGREEVEKIINSLSEYVIEM